MTPILGIIASSFRSAAGPDGAYDALATVTVPSGGLSTITFAGIPNTYKHLQIRFTSRDDRAASSTNVIIRFNLDSSANYSFHELVGNGTTATSSGSSGETRIVAGSSNSASSTTNNFSANIIDILDYSSASKNKTTRSLRGLFANSGDIRLLSGLWINTAPITTITLQPSTVNSFVQNSQFTLYGVK